MSEKVRVRFAPSPTGYLHVGGARTALFNWLFARQKGGTFVLRLEDTDAERNTEQARATIFRGLDWLGLTPDEGPEQGGPYGPYSQSERQQLYIDYGRKIADRDGLYPCFCTKERLDALRTSQETSRQTMRYDRHCRGIAKDDARRRIAAGEEHTWRLRVPDGGTTAIDDLIRGRVAVENKDIEDIILIRSNGVPVYNFAVVIDDHTMAITHVIRGEDHLTNTFKQVLIYQAMDWKVPTFAHLPLILGPSGEGKLSKRKHPEAACEMYQKKGYPVEGLINWLALIGWSFDDKTEIMTRAELVERFSIERVNSSGARLPMDKLDWISGDYIRRMELPEVVAGILPFMREKGWVSEPLSAEDRRRVELAAAADKERLRYFQQIQELAGWAFEKELVYEEKAAANLKKPEAAGYLEAYAPVLLAGDFDDPSGLEKAARQHCETAGIGFGKLVHPVRAALTGRTQGPGLFHCAQILGREEVRRRLERGIAYAKT